MLRMHFELLIMNRFLVPFLIALTGHFVTTPQPILLCAVTSIAIILNGLVPLKQILLVWKLLIFLFLKIYPRLLTFLLVFLIMMLILLSSSELLVSTFARNCFFACPWSYIFLSFLLVVQHYSWRRMDYSAILKIIAHSSSASGPDLIPITVLKHCLPELSSILFLIFFCFTCFPSGWKRANVAPVFKNSGESLINSRLESLGLFSDLLVWLL